MSRLTIRYYPTNEAEIYGSTSIKEILEKLAHYEDLEEQGRLITLPCKVGDTVYFVSNIGCGFIGDCIKPCDGCNYAEYRIEVLNFEILDYGFLGETVFLTKEEAEAKLAELKGE